MKRLPGLLTRSQLQRAWGNCLRRIKIDAHGCWIYHGSRNRGGYGTCGTPLGNRLVHVVSYTIHCGEPPRHLVVSHKCHNPACCNPVHLRPITQKENVAESIQRGTFHYNYRKPKLTDQQRQSIRLAYDGSVKCAQRLAVAYGVSLSLVQKIIYRKESSL